jgi:hypothetical protein
MRGAAFVSAAAVPMQQQLVDQVKLDRNKTYKMWMGIDLKT